MLYVHSLASRHREDTTVLVDASVPTLSVYELAAKNVFVAQTALWRISGLFLHLQDTVYTH